MTQEQISQRIREIATKFCAEYPNVHATDDLDLLYAIESTLEGWDAALEDWRKMCYILAEKAGIDNDQLCILWEQKIEGKTKLEEV